ncbi:MAG: hypothetical protein ABW185_11845 [Sedimenticola sp.]
MEKDLTLVLVSYLVAAEILYFMFFKMAAILDLKVRITSKLPTNLSMLKLVETDMSFARVPYLVAISCFSRWLPAAILDFALWRKTPGFLGGTGGLCFLLKVRS